jgi:RNA polymerase sigma factor (sigma-70 family)
MERFYEVFFDRVYGYVRRMLNEDHLAEDVTQDVFMHIQRSIHTYDPSRDPGPWVFTIATNKVRDFWRTRRHKEAGLEASLDDEERKFRAPSRDPGPLPELEREEMSRELSKAIDELPPGMRETLVPAVLRGALVRGDRGEGRAQRDRRAQALLARAGRPARGAGAVHGAWTSAGEGGRMMPARGHR